jgi:signal peptidase I
MVTPRQAWKYVWEGEGVIPFILNVLIAFVFIYFIVYPGLSFLLGTNFPIVAVISGSMEHDGNFDTWWRSNCRSNQGQVSQAQLYNSIGISKEEFLEYSFKDGFNTGDIMVLGSPAITEVGDVIVFMSGQPHDPIIHRLIANSDGNYLAKGDHNCYSAAFEQSIRHNQLVGKALFRIPYLGYIKIIFVNIVGYLNVL